MRENSSESLIPPIRLCKLPNGCRLLGEGFATAIMNLNKKAFVVYIVFFISKILILLDFLISKILIHLT